MKKNRIAHNGEIGICAIASGYTTKASPGPLKRRFHICHNFIFRRFYFTKLRVQVKVTDSFEHTMQLPVKLTRTCNCCDVFVELSSHETKGGKDNKASKNTRSTVDQRNHHGISNHEKQHHTLDKTAITKIIHTSKKAVYLDKFSVITNA